MGDPNCSAVGKEVVKMVCERVGRLSPANATDGFSFVPLDGDFNVNRTFPAFTGLGDLNLYIRPAGVEHFVLPMMPYMRYYPSWTRVTTINAPLGVSRVPRPQKSLG